MTTKLVLQPSSCSAYNAARRALEEFPDLSRRFEELSRSSKRHGVVSGLLKKPDARGKFDLADEISKVDDYIGNMLKLRDRLNGIHTALETSVSTLAKDSSRIGQMSARQGKSRDITKRKELENATQSHLEAFMQIQSKDSEVKNLQEQVQSALALACKARDEFSVVRELPPSHFDGVDPEGGGASAGAVVAFDGVDSEGRAAPVGRAAAPDQEESDDDWLLVEPTVP